ncbi:MAG: hypothetical protein AB7G06_01755 [Bdellovibrionales bacterium]
MKTSLLAASAVSAVLLSGCATIGPSGADRARDARAASYAATIASHQVEMRSLLTCSSVLGLIEGVTPGTTWFDSLSPAHQRTAYNEGVVACRMPPSHDGESSTLSLYLVDERLWILGSDYTPAQARTALTAIFEAHAYLATQPNMPNIFNERMAMVEARNDAGVATSYTLVLLDNDIAVQVEDLAAARPTVTILRGDAAAAAVGPQTAPQ